MIPATAWARVVEILYFDRGLGSVLGESGSLHRTADLQRPRAASTAALSLPSTKRLNSESPRLRGPAQTTAIQKPRNQTVKHGPSHRRKVRGQFPSVVVPEDWDPTPVYQRPGRFGGK